MEKKEPPIITIIKNINDKFILELSSDIPMFDTLLEIENNKVEKL